MKEYFQGDEFKDISKKWVKIENGKNGEINEFRILREIFDSLDYPDSFIFNIKELRRVFEL
uniref:hypothetical protein n=1 Tax=Lactococcus sp. TaxID=44273 RepID=UPI0032421830